MSLMTGLYPRTLGLMDNNEETSVTEKATSSRELYLNTMVIRTYAFGKRHLKGSGADHGWDIRKEVHPEEGDDGNYLEWITAQGYQPEFSNDWAAEFGKGPKGQ
jgi:arylsulfatase A-like enzyme